MPSISRYTAYHAACLPFNARVVFKHLLAVEALLGRAAGKKLL